MSAIAQPTFNGVVKIEGDEFVIRGPIEEIHGLRVALAECPCRAPKSIATKSIRTSISTALAALEEKLGKGR
ncbi:hypothetical protein [Epibacterium ulvae]|uniref:hypothetical protein n=1 Tax=Epibacterium ulvae TaxID=1156985 RepID=UPI002491EAC6|nr:hypothetical protein [Epibacterium ulvae]